jgi:putative MATE family efflux protein
MYMALAGMGDGAQILIARRIGQQNTNAIGRIFGTSIFTHFVVAGILFLFIQFAIPDMLRYWSRHDDLSAMQTEYIGIRSYALFFAMISLSIQAFFLATGKTWVVLIAAIITASSNILLDYLMIFGKGGFPEMGLSGAAWASTLADLFGMLFLVSYLVFSTDSKQFRLFAHFSFNLPSMKELFKVGSPLMFQGFIALATWTLFFTWLEQSGKFELTVSQNVRSIYFLAFVPIWGFAGTTKTYISQYLGKGDLASLPKIQRKIQFLTLIFLFIFFHGAILYPESMVRMINPGETYIEKSAEILRFISVSIFMYGIFSVYFQTINGSGNTMATFTIEILCALVYIFSTFLLIKVIKPDIKWIWMNEYIYFGCMGLCSILYLRLFEWRKKEI